MIIDSAIGLFEKALNRFKMYELLSAKTIPMHRELRPSFPKLAAMLKGAAQVSSRFF